MGMAREVVTSLNQQPASVEEGVRQLSLTILQKGILVAIGEATELDKASLDRDLAERDALWEKLDSLREQEAAALKLL